MPPGLSCWRRARPIGTGCIGDARPELTFSRFGPPGASPMIRWPRPIRPARKVTGKVPDASNQPPAVRSPTAASYAPAMQLTERRKKVFLAELARHGILARAGRAASPRASSRFGALQTFKDERERDPEFARQWDEAMEAAKASVEHELFRRAQLGWEEPVYGGKYREQVVGTVRRYSDRLLELRAKALLPAYRETSNVSVNGRVTHGVDAGVLGDAVAKVAMRLAETLRALPAHDASVIDHEPR